MFKGAFHIINNEVSLLPGDVHSALGQGPGVGSSTFQPQFRDRLSFSSLNLGHGHTQELGSLPPGHAGYTHTQISSLHHNISQVIFCIRPPLLTSDLVVTWREISVKPQLVSGTDQVGSTSQITTFHSYVIGLVLVLQANLCWLIILFILFMQTVETHR